MRISAWRRLAPLIVGLSVLGSLAGCGTTTGQPNSGRNTPQPTGGTMIPGIAPIQQQTQTRRIAALATYAPGGSGATSRLLVALENKPDGSYTALYDMALDGGDPRRIPLDSPCWGPLAVMPGAAWVACRSAAGVSLVALNPQTQPAARLLVARPDPWNVRGLAWSPDGAYLAVPGTTDGGCSLTLYAVASPSLEARPVAVLTFAQLVAQIGQTPGCTLFFPQWSPDGRWLTVADVRPPIEHVYGLPLASIMDKLTPSASAPVTLPIALSTLTRFGDGAAGIPPVWSPAPASMLTVASTDRRSVVAFRAPGDQGLALLTVNQPQDYISAFAWSLDGAKVLVNLTPPIIPEAAGPPDAVYLYTPHV